MIRYQAVMLSDSNGDIPSPSESPNVPTPNITTPPRRSPTVTVTTDYENIIQGGVLGSLYLLEDDDMDEEELNLIERSAHCAVEEEPENLIEG
eukprot:Awhi_evm1s9866